jgi:hypothetical protein
MTEFHVLESSTPWSLLKLFGFFLIHNLIHNVDIFFNNLENIYKRYDALADGTRIYNLDETSTTTVHKPKKIVAQKGVKQVNTCSSGERGILVTTCCIVSASGNTIPPVMVFPRKN